MFRRTFIASLSSARECVPAGLEYEQRQDPENTFRKPGGARTISLDSSLVNHERTI